MGSNKLKPKWHNWTTRTTSVNGIGGGGGYSPSSTNIKPYKPPKNLKDFDKALKRTINSTGENRDEDGYCYEVNHKPNPISTRPKPIKKHKKLKKIKELRYRALPQKQREVINQETEYVGHLDWCEHFDASRKRRARGRPNRASDLQMVKNFRDRKFQNAVHLMLSKYSEDQLGADIFPGTEFWDMDALLDRAMSKVPIYNCMKDREYEKVILILDTSPSCAQQAGWYAHMSQAAAGAELVEMYDAPNAYITRKWDPRRERFVEFLEYETILKEEFSRWEKFNRRHIIFFGDHDGADIVANAAKHNTVHWFCVDENVAKWVTHCHNETYDDNGDPVYIPKPGMSKNLIPHTDIKIKEDFISAIRKLK
tara:strand:- start:18268 stop:19368 length:1101 start_codon:yes stop_codon:yes gene_type:complete